MVSTTRYYRGEKIVKGDGVVGYKPGEKVPVDLPKDRAQMEQEEQAPNPFTETRDKDGRFNPAAPRLCAASSSPRCSFTNSTFTTPFSTALIACRHTLHYCGHHTPA